MLPGRPAVADWLHGIAEWEPPETHVLGVQMSLFSQAICSKNTNQRICWKIIQSSRMKLLRDRTDRIFEKP